MPDTPELRRQIEELALQPVMGDPQGMEASSAPVWIPRLEHIRECALGQQATAVATAAAAAITALREIGEGPEAGQSIPAGLQHGIARLQEAMDREAASVPSQAAPLAEDAELLGDFIVESREHLAAIESLVLTLERDPHDAEALNSVFRGFHTIKGLAGFLEVWEVQKLAHEVETVLDLARDSRLTITAAAIDAILQSTDHLRRWLAHLEAGLRSQPSTAPARDEALISRIRALASPAEQETAPGLAQLASSVESKTEAAPEPPALDQAPAVAAPAPASDQAPAAAAPAASHSETMAVRVDTAKLDYLADMAGEMVIAESLVRHDPEVAAVQSPRLQRKIAQLTRITAELQKTAMAMRLVPIGPVFRRMARLVRDLSRQFGKQVEMETQGDEIALDRTIVEELSDPLMHMVRNALDHGIESPAERLEHGKNPVARLILSARHHGGQVVVEVADDGRGLDGEKIKAKAVQRGLIAPGAELSEAETYNLIFQPGFTTAAQVTSVSGRGVGMDVVRKHIEKLRGRIEIRSSPGQGSTFILKLPLTLAIIDGLVVGVGQERYIAPLFAVREMFRPSRETIWTVQQRVEVALVRDTLLPVLRLYKRFHVTPRSEDPMESVLVVAEAEGERFCLLVDELIGKQEVVIKSLGEAFQNIPGVAGGAILGDGRVGLILDLDGLFRERTNEAGR